MLDVLRQLAGRDRSETVVADDGNTPSRASPAMENAAGSISGGATKWLATQIPEYGGSDDENINAWIRRVDRVAQIHRASDGTVLLAASSRLVKFARQWYELQDGPVIESWLNLKAELAKMFERRVPFYKAMQKIEARKWIPSKESFDQYTITKLALMNSLDLPTKDMIHLLVGGITSASLRATALSVAGESLEHFLERMRCVTEGFAELDKKMAASTAVNKAHDSACRNCGKKGHSRKDCRDAVITCFYCKGHRSFDCPNLKNRDKKSTAQLTPSVNVTAAVEEETHDEPVAFVAEEDGRKLKLSRSVVEVDSIGGRVCQLTAMVDTGSPVSFIKYQSYVEYIEPYGYRFIAPK